MTLKGDTTTVLCETEKRMNVHTPILKPYIHTYSQLKSKPPQRSQDGLGLKASV